MNALASMVQSVVQEMKAVNWRVDQLSEPVNLEDEDLDYENQFFVSIQRSTSWPKPARRETKNQSALVLFMM